jgi:hypothetical protein
MIGVIGFNIGKIEASRSSEIKGKLSIKNNVQIKEVENADLFLGKTKQAGLRFKFEYTSEYEPSAGKIVLTGDLLAVEEEAAAKAIVAGWKKDKKVNSDVMAHVLNNVLNKCNILAIILSREINLPAPVQLPKVQTKK